MKKQTIIFYKTSADFAPLMEHGAKAMMLKGVMTAKEREDLLKSFEAKDFDVLLVPSGMITGWRTSLTHRECEVRFAGSNWREEELAQGRLRIVPDFIALGRPAGRVTYVSTDLKDSDDTILRAKIHFVDEDGTHFTMQAEEFVCRLKRGTK